MTYRFANAACRDPRSVRRQDPDQIVVAVGRRITEVRRKKMTQAEFPEAMRSSVQWVSRIERLEPDASCTRQIANLLGVRVAELLEPPRSVKPAGPGRVHRGCPSVQVARLRQFG